MAKMYKVELYVTDLNGRYEEGGVQEIFERCHNETDTVFDWFNVQETEFEWDDELPINMLGCPVREYRKYFKSDKE